MISYAVLEKRLKANAVIYITEKKKEKSADAEKHAEWITNDNGETG